MDNTARLALPFIVAGQALKHITHNEALGRLDALVQPVVEAATLAVPPASPLAGEAWLVPAGAGGAWAGHGREIAAWQDGAWRFFDPAPGWQVYDRQAGALKLFSGTDWVAIAAPRGRPAATGRQCQRRRRQPAGGGGAGQPLHP